MNGRHSPGDVAFAPLSIGLPVYTHFQHSLQETHSTFERVVEFVSVIRTLARDWLAQNATRLHAATQRAGFYEDFQSISFYTDLHAAEIRLFLSAQNCTAGESRDPECSPSEKETGLRPHGPVMTRPCERDLEPRCWQTPAMHRHVKEPSMPCHQSVRTVRHHQIRPGETRPIFV